MTRGQGPLSPLEMLWEVNLIVLCSEVVLFSKVPLYIGGSTLHANYGEYNVPSAVSDLVVMVTATSRSNSPSEMTAHTSANPTSSLVGYTSISSPTVMVSWSVMVTPAMGKVLDTSGSSLLRETMSCSSSSEMSSSRTGMVMHCLDTVEVKMTASDTAV